jgi:hypothetical protein
LSVRQLPDADRGDDGIGGELLRVPLPSDADTDTRALIERVVELTETLARRCVQLQQALDSRVVIEQAKGVLAERLDVSPEEAFFLLRGASRRNRIRIHDLAQRVVAEPTTPAELAPFVGTR